MNEIVEDHRYARVTRFIDESCSVLENHHCRGLAWIVLRRDVNPVIMRRAGIDIACRPGMFRYLAGRDARLARRVRTVLIFFAAEQRR